MTANPAIVEYLQTQYADLHIDTFSGCVRVFAHATPIVADEVEEPDGFGGNAYAQCAFLEQVVPITYPFVFAEPPELPLPWFTGANRAECSRILFGLHAAAVALFPGGPG